VDHVSPNCATSGTPPQAAATHASHHHLLRDPASAHTSGCTSVRAAKTVYSYSFDLPGFQAAATSDKKHAAGKGISVLDLGAL